MAASSCYTAEPCCKVPHTVDILDILTFHVYLLADVIDNCFNVIDCSVLTLPDSPNILYKDIINIFRS